jgi:hypothetical protein
MGLSLLEEVEHVYARVTAQDADPWRAKLERLRGRIGDDGVERITTQTVFDFLQVPPRHRSTPAHHRLCSLMVDLGWTSMRIRGLNCGGRKDRARGYVRRPKVP